MIGGPGPVIDGPGPPAACLVTGASGFIGGHVAQRLVEQGHEVRCLVRAGSDTARLVEMGASLCPGDLTDGESLAAAARGCRYVVHCGAMVSDWALPEEIETINVTGTRSLLAACAAASVERVVHISSTDVYGYPGDAGVDEARPPARFANWYAQTKRAAETEVRRAEAAHGLDCVILRPATVYGPRSTSVVGEMARALRAGHMVLVGGGRAVAGLCYVENLVDAVVLGLSHVAARGGAFNVTDGLPTTWREFLDDLAAGLGCPPVRFSLPYPLAVGLGFTLEHGYRRLRRATGFGSAPLLSRQAVHVLGRPQDFSNRRAREVLEWEPRVGYRTALAATLDWLTAEYLQL